MYPVGSQVYKLELPKRWRIHNVFHMSLLEQDTTRKGRVIDTETKLEFKAGSNKEYQIEVI